MWGQIMCKYTLIASKHSYITKLCRQNDFFLAIYFTQLCRKLKCVSFKTSKLIVNNKY